MDGSMYIHDIGCRTPRRKGPLASSTPDAPKCKALLSLWQNNCEIMLLIIFPSVSNFCNTFAQWILNR